MFVHAMAKQELYWRGTDLQVSCLLSALNLQNARSFFNKSNTLRYCEHNCLQTAENFLDWAYNPDLAVATYKLHKGRNGLPARLALINVFLVFSFYHCTLSMIFITNK